MEAVVGMVVMAVVMGIVFMIFTIISERMQDFKDQNQYVADLNRLTYSVNKDIFENEKWMAIEEGFVFYSYSGDRVLYSIRERYILRTKLEFIDTFNIPIKQLKLDTIGDSNKRIVFQKAKLLVEVNQQPMNLSFFKKVYADELIKSIKE